MSVLIEMENVTKRFNGQRALQDVSLAIDGPKLIGLIGRNGSGKSTLIRHVLGLYLPDQGRCRTLGADTSRLGSAELSRIGAVHQRDALFPWMSVRQIVRYVGTFYERWDSELAGRLLDLFQLHRDQRVETLSPGNLQRLALVLAVCHHPELMLLDEPLSDLDPIARRDVLRALLDRFGGGDATIVVSSHMLNDVESIVDHVLCLDGGRVAADQSLDSLLEEYAEWIVRPGDAGVMPTAFAEPYIVSVVHGSSGARVTVRSATESGSAFAARHSVLVDERRLNLEQIFPLLVEPAVPEALSA